MKKLLLFLLFLIFVQVAKGQVPIEPDAIGGGKNTIGWRDAVNMKICIVDSLSKDRNVSTISSNVQRGSLKGCLLRSDGVPDTAKKLIVFNGLQGTINLSGNYNTSNRLQDSPMIVTGGNKYIAGQTGNVTINCKDVPSVTSDQESGHCIFNKSYSNTNKQDHVAIKGLNVISGIKTAVNASNTPVPFTYSQHVQTGDNINMVNVENIYLDNVVTLWGQDENIDFSANTIENDTASNRRKMAKVSLTRSIIAENIKQPDGHFSACLIAYGNYLANVVDGVDFTIARNIFSGCAARTPDFKLAELEFINNFNFGFNSYSNSGIRGGAKVDLVKNIFKNCPAGKCFGVRQYGSTSPSGDAGYNRSASLFLDSNSVEDSSFLTNDNTKFISYIAASSPNSVRTFSPYFPTYSVERQLLDTTSSQILSINQTKKILDDDSYFNRRMIDEFGNWIPKENPYAERVVKNWKNNYNPSISDPSSVGIIPPVNDTTLYVDTDNDGIPDQYEFLNTGVASSTGSLTNNADSGDGYLNIEKYLHGREYLYGSWTPAQLPKLKAWFDVCDSKAVTLNGNKISEIRSKRGYKTTYTLVKANQANSTLQPVKTGCFATGTGATDERLTISSPIQFKEALFVYKNFDGSVASTVFENSSVANDRMTIAGVGTNYSVSVHGNTSTSYDENKVYFNSSVLNIGRNISFPNIIGENTTRNPILPDRESVDVVGVVYETAITTNTLFSANSASGASLDVGEWLFFDQELTEEEKNKVVAYLHFKHSTGVNNQTPYTKAPAFLPEEDFPEIPTPTPVPWSPSQLSGLAAWYDASDSSTITLNGSTVSQWSDKSGNNRHATQPTAANQPTYTANGLNGKPVLTFNGTTNIMQVGGPAFATGARSAIAVARFVGSNRGLAQLKNADGTFFDLIANPGGSYRAVSFVGDLASASAVGFGNPGASITTDPVILQYQYNGGTNTLPENYAATLNGDPQTILSSGLFIGVDTNSSGLGGRLLQNNAPQFPLSGFIAEDVVLDGAVSTTDRQKLEGYLAWKWGLTANLPIGHPYKTTAP